MPYTEPGSRLGLDPRLVNLELPDQGDLTYAIARLMVRYVAQHGQNYTSMSQARASCADAADEFYRIVMAPYEDQKRRINGDCWDPLVVDRA